MEIESHITLGEVQKKLNGIVYNNEREQNEKKNDRKERRVI